MNDEEFKQLNDETKAAKLGRPLGDGEGTWTTSCSVPYSFKALCKKYDISPSNALKEGVLMLLNQNEHFPQTTYEELLVKGIFIEQKRKFANRIMELVK